MESKMALTTPSTSRCVRSGKSVHSFCTSSERIIVSPREGHCRPRTPPNRGPVLHYAVRKLCPAQDRSEGGVPERNAAFYNYFFFLVAFSPASAFSLSAAPRMSPSEAPESDEP